MHLENNDFFLTHKEILPRSRVVNRPRPAIYLVTRTPKRTLLKRLSLGGAISAVMRIVRRVQLETTASRQSMFSRWNFHKIYTHIMADPQYKNSFFNMASTFVLGGLGFVFWMIIAHLYNTENVGIATTLISITTLLSSFTILGLNSSLTRYLPKSANKHELINSAFVIVTIATLLPSAIFFLGIRVFSPQLLFLRSNIFYILSFILFTIFTSWNILVDSIFMAFRAAGNILIKNTSISIAKLVLPFAFIVFGAYGIFASTASGLVLGVLVGLMLLNLKFHITPSLSVNFSLVKEHSLYSLANYLVIFIRSMPSLVLPVIVFNSLSAKYAAYYYIAAMIQSILLVIPIATEQALLAEGSHNEAELKKHIQKALATIVVILLPATTLIVVFGNIVLQFFGKSFATEAFQFLQLYSLSTIFTALLLIGSAVMNIQHKIKTLVLLNIIAASLTLGLSCAFLSGRLVGIGWGWILGQAIAGSLALYFIIRTYSDMPSILRVAKRGSGYT